MGRYLTERDTVIRARWGRFLEPIVGKGRVSVEALDAAFATRATRKGDGRNAIYAYLRGEATISAEKAYLIGESLRDCGLRWCSGPVALHGAGYLGDFVRVIARLTTYPEHKRSMAPALASLAPLANFHIRSARSVASLKMVDYDVAAWCGLARDWLSQYTINPVKTVGEAEAFDKRSLTKLAAIERFADDAAFAGSGMGERAVTAFLEEWAIESAEARPVPLRAIALKAAAESAEARARLLRRFSADADFQDKLDEVIDQLRTAVDIVSSTEEARKRLASGESFGDLLAEQFKIAQFTPQGALQ